MDAKTPEPDLLHIADQLDVLYSAVLNEREVSGPNKEALSAWLRVLDRYPPLVFSRHRVAAALRLDQGELPPEPWVLPLIAAAARVASLYPDRPDHTLALWNAAHDIGWRNLPMPGHLDELINMGEPVDGPGEVWFPLSDEIGYEAVVIEWERVAGIARGATGSPDDVWRLVPDALAGFYLLARVSDPDMRDRSLAWLAEMRAVVRAVASQRALPRPAAAFAVASATTSLCADPRAVWEQALNAGDRRGCPVLGWTGRAAPHAATALAHVLLDEAVVTLPVSRYLVEAAVFGRPCTEVDMALLLGGRPDHSLQIIEDAVRSTCSWASSIEDPMVFAMVVERMAVASVLSNQAPGSPDAGSAPHA